LTGKAKIAAAAASAWETGLRAAQQGDPDVARRWLERAHRLAPEDPRLELDLANIWLALAARDRSGRTAAKAAAAFAALARRYDIAAAWQGLIAARRLTGDPAALSACADYLATLCIDPAFAGLAAAIAGNRGWCGAAPDGALRVEAPAGANLAMRLDGRAIAAPKRLPDGARLAITADGEPLLGSPLDLSALRRVEGLVAAGPEGLRGWACRPAAPAEPPALTLTDADGRERAVTFTGAVPPADQDAPFLRRHEFLLPAAALAGFAPPFRLRGGDGRDVLGSPVHPGAQAGIAPVPATRLGRRVTRLPARRTLAVVVPAYRDLAVTSACLDSLFAAVPARTRIIVVDDATPEPALAQWLDGLAATGRIELIRHADNRGFPAAANAGIAAAGKRDVLLLNSDTLLPPGAIGTLRAVAYARPEIGSVTPLSNEATICSYPDVAGGNPAPDLAATIRLNRLALTANRQGAVPIPTGIGFCLFLRHDCLAATGVFRDNVFAQGYGEEVDWCLRAGALGWRHVAATGAFVAHRGGVSFRAAGQALNRRNAAILNRLHPGYDAMIGKFVARDPLAPARRRLDLARFAAGRAASAVLLISHNHGGGVARRVAEDMAAIRAAGQRPLLLVPAAPADPEATPFPWDPVLTDGAAGDYPSLVFPLPAALPALQRLLRAERVARVILHHGLGHHAAIRGLAAALGVPQEIVIHDYASFCPRVNLVSRAGPALPPRYCGEPNVAGCVACVKANGDETFERLGVRRLVRRSALEFAAAARVTTPSADAARRIARHFAGVQPVVTPWEDDTVAVALTPPRRLGKTDRALKIVVIGGIGPAKGFEVLLACAADSAARKLPLEFIVAGASADDERLLAAGIFVTGAYPEGGATPFIKEIAADLAFFPSIWPETWCFALSEAWRAGLYAIAFDLGAQAARIRATGRGGLLPLGLPAPRINESLLAWQPDLRNSPVPNRTLT
jgi:GT2 family glycosyltransferase/glycosyltransferase involved in cell wall biosynthesis